MKFICDVHISYKLRNFLQKLGFVAIHVNEILDKWETEDKVISSYADENDLIIITKDSDFVDSYHIRKSPRKLVVIRLGNFSTNVMIQLFSDALPLIQKVYNRTNFLIEIEKDQAYLFND